MSGNTIIESYESTNVTVSATDDGYIVEHYDELLASFDVDNEAPRAEALAYASGYHNSENNPLEEVSQS